jgi:hypothetical protein
VKSAFPTRFAAPSALPVFSALIAPSLVFHKTAVSADDLDVIGVIVQCRFCPPVPASKFPEQESQDNLINFGVRGTRCHPA